MQVKANWNNFVADVKDKGSPVQDLRVANSFECKLAKYHHRKTPNKCLCLNVWNMEGGAGCEVHITCPIF